MNLEKDFVCDYSLQLFVRTKTCPEIFFPVGPFKTCKYRDVLIRQVLHTIMCSVIKAQTADVKIIRMIFEDLPSLIKSLDGFANTTDLKQLVDHYYEEVVELFQLVALDEQQNDSVATESLQNLKSSTAVLIAKFREQLKPPFVVTVFKEYEKKLNERLDTSSDDTSDAEARKQDDDGDVASVDSIDVEIESQDSASVIYEQSSVVSETASESDNAAVEVNINNCEEHVTGENPESFQQIDTPYSLAEKEADSIEIQGVSSLSAAGKNTELSTTNVTNSASAPQAAINNESTRDCYENEPTINLSPSPKSNIRNNEQHNTKPFDAVEVELNSTKVRKRRPFRAESDAMLIHGVKKYGLSEWKKIHESYDFPAYRKPMHLKDRWRTLRENKLISVDQDKISVIAEKQATAFKNYLEKNPFDAEPSHDNSRLERTNDSVGTDDAEREAPVPQPLKTSSPMTRSKTRNTLPSFHQLISRQTSEPSPISDHRDSEEEQSVVSGKRDTQNTDESALPSTFPRANETRSNKKESPSTLSSSLSQRLRKRRKRRLWEADGQMLTWDTSATLQNTSSAKKPMLNKKTTERKHKKKPWRDWEVSSLIKGLRRYGVGQWSMILDQYRFSNRDSIMLKDKYRNMLKNKELPRDLSLMAGLKASLELSAK